MAWLKSAVAEKGKTMEIRMKGRVIGYPDDSSSRGHETVLRIQEGAYNNKKVSVRSFRSGVDHELLVPGRLVTCQVAADQTSGGLLADDVDIFRELPPPGLAAEFGFWIGDVFTDLNPQSAWFGRRIEVTSQRDYELDRLPGLDVNEALSRMAATEHQSRSLVLLHRPSYTFRIGDHVRDTVVRGDPVRMVVWLDRYTHSYRIFDPITGKVFFRDANSLVPAGQACLLRQVI